VLGIVIAFRVWQQNCDVRVLDTWQLQGRHRLVGLEVGACHIIIITLPDQAIASTPSAPRPPGAEERGSTAPLCLQPLRTSQAFTRYAAMLLDTSRQTPLLPQTSCHMSCERVLDLEAGW
jgi:hypothetical protein